MSFRQKVIVWAFSERDFLQIQSALPINSLRYPKLVALSVPNTKNRDV
jgi:hypothetical protein